MSWLLGALLLAPVLADVCHSRHFRELRGNEDDDYVLYGLTQVHGTGIFWSMETLGLPSLLHQTATIDFVINTQREYSQFLL